MTPTPIFQFPSGPTEGTEHWKIFSCRNYLAYGALLELRSEASFQESTRALTLQLLLDMPIDIIISVRSVPLSPVQPPNEWSPDI
ncbi:hypothetical protein C8J56DRAFT_1037317 [Mycena floridula]|nr:hypothetical protein C8J56DRAFT_1037317 [Mycena floridula]